MISYSARLQIIKVFDVSSKMVAQNPAIFSNFCGHVRQVGRSFGALAQNLARTAIHLNRKCTPPAAKTTEADLFETAAPEIKEVVNRQKPKKITKIVETKKEVLWKT